MDVFSIFVLLLIVWYLDEIRDELRALNKRQKAKRNRALRLSSVTPGRFIGKVGSSNRRGAHPIGRSDTP